MASTSKQLQKKVTLKICWDGSYFEDPRSYVIELLDGEKGEICKALEWFQALGASVDKVDRDTFPLPTLGPKLEGLAKELYEGRGFLVIRGLDPKDFDHAANITIFLGLSCYVGEQRGRQCSDGRVFTHIKRPQSLGLEQDSPPFKYTDERAEFHNDLGCDILATYVTGVPQQGGDSFLASCAHILTKMREHYPELADEILKPTWPFDIRQRWAEHVIQPLFYEKDSKVLATVIPNALRGLPGVKRPEGLPDLTPTQDAALDAVLAVAKESSVTVQTALGDLLLVNNFALVHGREAFGDSDESRRYLVRLWLRNKSLAWPLPDHMQAASRAVFEEGPELEYNIILRDVPNFDIGERMTP